MIIIEVILHKHSTLKKLITILFVVLLHSNNLFAQNTSPFNVLVKGKTINGLGGLQAYAWGAFQNEWLIVGGRLDGLHRRQPFASFDIAGNNDKIWVVNPLTKQVWSSALTLLPISIQEQLSSTNMEFHQEDSILYIIGGYGYNTATASKITFPNISALNVPAIINAIKNNQPFTNSINQIEDTSFAVCGGHLKKINSDYYLIGGNNFNGDYNPMGNPTYTQTYTNAIRKFRLHTSGNNITIQNISTTTDPTALHRRDYNAVQQIMPTGEEGITAFSGVFQPTVNLPYLNCVNIDSNTYSVNNSFQQFYNHYHCAVLPIYSEQSNEMHSIFFGGIAQFYDSAGITVQDNSVPFVKTIARVTRDASGVMSEYKLDEYMPDFLGAGSEFIPIDTIPHYANGVLKLDSIFNDTTLVGYIYGGIKSSAKNIFTFNNGSQSVASNSILEVYLLKNKTLSQVDQINNESNLDFSWFVVGDKNQTDEVSIIIETSTLHTVNITLLNSSGQLIYQKPHQSIPAGNSTIKLKRPMNSGTYFVNMNTDGKSHSRKIIIE